MLRPVDIAVLLKLTIQGAAEMSFQQLASDLHLSPSEVHGSCKRSNLSRLLNQGVRKTVNRTALMQFLEHGVRYAFPVEQGALSRGIPTAYAAEPLRSAIQQGNDPPPIWPYVEGTVRGYSFAPLYKRAALAALADPQLYELLSLVDALRDGRIRERKLALEMLTERIDQRHGELVNAV
jgi:hypothetical protein